MRPTVYVIGAGGHAKVVIAALQAAGHRIGGVFDDDPARRGGSVLGERILGPIPALEDWPDGQGIVALGSNEHRRQIVERLAGIAWATVVHPGAIVHPSVSIDHGSVVMAGAVIQPESRIGAHTIVNSRSSVDHDCRIGQFVHLCPGTTLAGSVEVGEGAMVGTGAVAIPGVRIGCWTVIGAGSCVVRDVPDYVLAIGCPARVRSQGKSEPVG